MDGAKKNSVLIVDDESLNIMALTRILSPEYTVYSAKDGQGHKGSKASRHFASRFGWL